jgi:hypothetical protein
MYDRREVKKERNENGKCTTLREKEQLTPYTKLCSNTENRSISHTLNTASMMAKGQLRMNCYYIIVEGVLITQGKFPHFNHDSSSRRLVSDFHSRSRL